MEKWLEATSFMTSLGRWGEGSVVKVQEAGTQGTQDAHLACLGGQEQDVEMEMGMRYEKIWKVLPVQKDNQVEDGMGNPESTR